MTSSKISPLPASALTRRAVFASAAALTLSGCATARSAHGREEGPGAGPWRPASPESQGLDGKALAAAAATLAAPGERQGLVVIRNGRLVFEQYWANAYARATPDWRNVSFSSGKSWGSTMVGHAYTNGLLGLDDLATWYDPALVSGLNPNTTIRHLLTMSSGGTLNVKPSSVRPKKLDDTSPPGPAAEYKLERVGEAGSPPGYGLSIAPGTTFYYDGAAADHLADIISAAAQISSHQYMIERIAHPLGCENFSYQPEGVDHNDNVRIGGSITLSCRDMARLGQLYLNKGRWGGRTLIAADYIEEAVSPSRLNPAYGYLWWLNGTGRTAKAPRSMFMANGARGQFCFVLPEQNMVIASMGFGEAQLSADAAWDALAAVLPA